MIHPKQKSIESPFYCRPTFEVQTPTGLTSCAALLYIYYPFAADDASFGLEDGGLLNELTLWMFDSGYWWSTSEPVLTQRVFCSGLFPVSTLCSSRCLWLPSSQSTFPEKCPLEDMLFISVSFYPLWSIILYTLTVCFCSPSPHFLCSAQPLCPSPACPAADLAFVGEC